jgi:5'-3' exonuclease
MRILAIDFSALFRRNWEATGGKELSEAYARTLRTVAEIREGFDRVALLCDSGSSFRKALLPTYKADREKPPAPYYEQLNRTVARLMADGCVPFSAPMVPEFFRADGGFDSAAIEERWAEADDLCASLAQWCIANGHSLIIYGGDKDLLQCATGPSADHTGTIVNVWRPDHAGLWDAKRCAESDKIGVPPERIPDWLALGGDASDGFKMFPGWEEPDPKDASKTVKRPGIGPGNAAKLLARFGTILGVIDAAMFEPDDADGPAQNPFPPSHQRDVIRRAKPSPIEAAQLGLRLATLVRDLPVDWSVLEADPEVRPIAPPSPAMAPAPDVAEGEIVAEEHAEMALYREAPSGLARFGEQYKSAQAMMDLATRFYDGRFFGSFPNAEALFTVMWLAHERGENVGHALTNAYVIKVGKPPGYLAVYLAARVKRSPVCKVFRIIESTRDHAVLEYQRTDDPEPKTFRFDLSEAESAGWIKKDGAWESRPRAMCINACMREAARAFFPDVVAGMADADEHVGG